MNVPLNDFERLFEYMERLNQIDHAIRLLFSERAAIIEDMDALKKDKPND